MKQEKRKESLQNIRIEKVRRAGVYDVYEICLKDKLIGDCQFRIEGSLAFLYQINIFKEYQRKGYGSSFLKYLEEVAKSEGCKHMIAEWVEDEIAISFFTGKDFKKMEEKDYLRTQFQRNPGWAYYIKTFP